ncbi:phosphatase PAP2 family protein [Pseudodonghicola flavimaris]|uniref:Phosphatase PAP2 family protein n=1 Tax=Pseudodonghicola flavimaris TaxID=3050036 RepID=A0ABT7EXN1_9RHOB|nr:phosphatase PAP2 family protein [Pseudodonghicola flavimaris]MDK3017089.1 phosphatase PAP2 family protein [Pseudodonghicola flavimaris]
MTPRAPAPSSGFRIGPALMIAWLAACLIFAILPGIDIAVSRLFFDPQSQSFPLSDLPALQFLRKLLWQGLNLMLLAAVALTIQGIFTRHAMRIPTRVWAFCASLMLLGPGILVNLVLKAHWGRARPADLEIFGGTLRFTPPLQISDQCPYNCSFVSGEAAFLTSGAIIIGLLLWHVVPAHRRRSLVIALALVLVATASMRVMKGRHFLSDVVWSMILTATLAHLLARLFRLAPELPRLSPQAFRSDLRTILQIFRGFRPAGAAVVTSLKCWGHICAGKISQISARSSRHDVPLPPEPPDRPRKS